VATQQLQLARVQEVAHRANVSVNDVFLAICASALRRHMLDAGRLPDRSLIAGVPVSLREPGETGGNAVGFVWATLGTDLVGPRERLNAIHASMRAAKDHLRRMPAPARRLFTTMTMAPAIGVLLSGQAPHLPPPMNVTISNVPGPARPLYLNGARLAGFYPVSVPFQGQALNITCVTYNGQFNIGFTGSRDNLPHLQRLAAYSREALEELEATLTA
jgi:WS/DGAT/MGAT family acyltransferase